MAGVDASLLAKLVNALPDSCHYCCSIKNLGWCLTYIYFNVRSIDTREN